MRIEFSSVVIGSQVDQSLVDETGPLDILAGDEHLDTSKGTRWDETSTVARLGAPGDFIGLGVTNGGVWLRRSPDTEVWW